MSAELLIRTIPLVLGAALISFSAHGDPSAQKPNGPRSLRNEMILSVDSGKKTNADLLRIISGLSYLIKNQTTDAAREELYLSRSAAALALSRNYRLAKVHDDKTATAERKYAEMARDDADSVLKMQSTKPASKPNAMYYSGLALSDLGDTDGAQKRFLDAIKLAPNSEHAPLMSLLVAETSFEKEQYQDAISQYRMFYARLSDIQKVIAIYKTAWCQVNLRQWESAEKNFLRLAANRKAKDFAEDSKRDMAFVMTEHRDEPNILAFTAPEFKSMPGLRAEILTLVYKLYQVQSGTRHHPLLFAELMRIETDPAKRLSLVIGNIRAQQREYASNEPYNEYLDLRTRMKQLNVKPDSALFGKIAGELETELKVLIRSYSDTFFGGSKTPENIPQDEIGKRLIDLLSFHVFYYPKSQDRLTSYEAWMEVCAKLKDYQCQYRVAKDVLSDQNLKSLRHRALLQLIGALDELQSKDQKLRPEFIASMKTFYEESPGDPEWLRVTKRYSAMLDEEKRYDEAIPVLQKIDAKETSSESKYRLVWAYFQSGQFAQAIATPGPFADDKFGKDSLEIVRESHLRVADQEINKNDFAAYEKNIQGYLASNPDQKKRDLVERDYLNRLIDHNGSDRVQEQLLKMPAQKRFFGDFAVVTGRLLDDHLKNGKFVNAVAVLQHPNSVKLPENFELDLIGAEIGSGEPIGRLQVAKIAQLPPKQRQYFMGVLALTRPEVLIEYFSGFGVVKPLDRPVYLLALQVKAGHWDIDPDPKTVRQLGSTLPLELRQTGPTPSELRAKKIQFPSEKMSATRRTKAVQEIALTTRQLRKTFIRDLTGKLPRVQMRILQAGIDLEGKVAQLILDSPVPNGLTDAQKTEYQSGLAELSKEFKNQSLEYQKLHDSIDQKDKAGNAENKDIDAFSLDKWPDSKSPAANVVHDLIGKSNFSGALITLDRWKELGVVADPEYFVLRVRILLSQHSGPFMKEYVYHELSTAKQDALVQQWKGAH